MRAYVLVGLTAAALLLLNAPLQVVDSTFYATTSAMLIRAGDVPYRDFFEPGGPLSAYTAAAVDWLGGHRVIGELLRQWAFIIGGLLLSFRLGVRASGSIRAPLLLMVFAVPLLATTPAYHYSKLFFFPLFILAAWRYLEVPTRPRAAGVAAVTALAFLFRHDYGLYLGAGSAMAFLLARMANPAARSIRSMAADAGVYAATTIALLMPWLIAVLRYEGIREYVQFRAALNQPAPSVLSWLPGINPVPLLVPASRPRRASDVEFEWRDEVSADQRAALQRQFTLTTVAERPAGERSRYSVPDAGDPVLLDLFPYIRFTEGIEWPELMRQRWRVPERYTAIAWLQGLATVVALALIGVGMTSVVRELLMTGVATPMSCGLLLAGGFLTVVASHLFRESAYVLTVLPTITAFASWFLVHGGWLGRAAAIAAVPLIALVTVAWVWGAPMTRPLERISGTPETIAGLSASPPELPDPRLAYIRDCAVAGDRVLVAGSTPLHVSYYTGLPIAGGHINWHRGWGSDQAHEARSLAMIDAAPVPFVISMSDPITSEFRDYPRIRAYLAAHYRAVDQAGMLLVDTRRPRTRSYGAEAYPCFS